ncbi:MAG: arsenate reductase family protein [Clostridia bacterium]|nr:arsenate reductase family protein [Clostridia bacterium]
MLVLWYPKCTTCQKAVKWLNDNGFTYELRDIKNENPSLEELTEWYEKSNLEIKRFFNTSGLLYKSMGLKEKLGDMNDEEKLRLLSSDGMLVKRPLLISENGIFPGFREKEWERLK